MRENKKCRVHQRRPCLRCGRMIAYDPGHRLCARCHAANDTLGRGCLMYAVASTLEESPHGV